MTSDRYDHPPSSSTILRYKHSYPFRLDSSEYPYCDRTRQTDFAGMNEVWRNTFPSNPPARSTLIVGALPRPEFVIELECMAHT